MIDFLRVICMLVLLMCIVLFAFQAKETKDPKKLIAGVGISALVLYFLISIKAVCPKCEASSKYVDVKRRYTSNASLKTFDEYGKGRGNIYWVRNYEDFHKCKKCGHEWIVKGEEKSKK